MPEVFTGIMTDAWIAASMVAVVAGVVGFFVVIRGSSFVAHAVPHGAFGGAAGAALLVGIDGTILGISGTIVGLGVFAVGGALGIGWLGRRGRHDVATALALVLMLGLGALFLSWSVEYAAGVYSLLFGGVFSVAAGELLPMAVLGALCLVAIATIYRPLMLSSVLPEVGEARGVRADRVETGFLLVVALATTMTVPVVGVLLMFSLMIGPAAAARCFTDNPGAAMALSVAIALLTVWLGIFLSYYTNWPLGFFVGVSGAVSYALGRAWSA
ncbi:MAG: metal ABC transporter permease, partial [Candidatus Dormiibacterota bacterium]